MKTATTAIKTTGMGVLTCEKLRLGGTEQAGHLHYQTLALISELMEFLEGLILPSVMMGILIAAMAVTQIAILKLAGIELCRVDTLTACELLFEEMA